MQIDDSIMQKNLKARLSYIRRIFVGHSSRSFRWSYFFIGKVNDPEETKITKWPGRQMAQDQ